MVQSGIDPLVQARGARLAALFEILETCEAFGDRIDLDVMVGVLTEAVTTIGEGPLVPRPVGDEERRMMCAIGTLLKAFSDMASLLAEKVGPGRTQRDLLQLRNACWEVLAPRLSRLTTEERAALLAESVKWGYSIWAPDHQHYLLRILERARDGRHMTKDLREVAGLLHDHLNPRLSRGEITEGSATP